MQCFYCGIELGSNQHYCSNCGLQQTKKSDKRQLKSFTEFMKSSNIKKKIKKDDSKQNITIHVGMLHMVKNSYRQVQGSRTPVFVESYADYDHLKRVAFDKLQRYVPDMVEYGYCDMELSYRSGKSALFLPGTLTEFTLERYKEDLGCKYSQITLYLKPNERNSDEEVDVDSQVSDEHR